MIKLKENFIPRREVEELMKEAYLEGFKATGEGYNGEYMFENNPSRVKIWNEIKNDPALSDLLTKLKEL